jgi:hypothetical protein
MSARNYFDSRLEVFMAVNIQIKVFWIVTPCSDVVGYQRFGGSCCLHVQGEEKKRWYFLSQHYTASELRRP